MTKQILDGATVAAGGGTTKATFRKERWHNVSFRLEAAAGGSDISVDLTGVKINDQDEASYADPNTAEGVANVNVSSSDLGFRFSEVDGYEDIEVTVTNNVAATGTDATVSLYAEGYRQ